jgi:hypothetical protein
MQQRPATGEPHGRRAVVYGPILKPIAPAASSRCPLRCFQALDARPRRGREGACAPHAWRRARAPLSSRRRAQPPCCVEASPCKPPSQAETANATRPLRVMISGAPAAGKGTQCARIVEKVRGQGNPGACRSGLAWRCKRRAGHAPSAGACSSGPHAAARRDGPRGAQAVRWQCAAWMAAPLALQPGGAQSGRPTQRPSDPPPLHRPPQYGFVHISAGDLLREQVSLGTPAGERPRASGLVSFATGCWRRSTWRAAASSRTRPSSAGQHYMARPGRPPTPRPPASGKLHASCARPARVGR